ncbi:hypothetical protein BT93_L0150 [Corymbia citriodora subsp. variegata]|uniref:DUF7138 domain-containing protein n=1 Tax=Corymbia citriodora subsp. variegata TaxID=360336 RepID=A0A8T0CU98_CORYI|nr:hypothetical protein BT93_L0150 [Corymbia citriodora subsp. variegata]
MQNAPAGALFPAFFSDGERETLLGTILVHPSLRFHDLRLTIAQQIGVPPHQFAVFLADHRDDHPHHPTTPSWPGKVAVTDRFDFAAAAAAARQVGARCCFLVVLKRSRRERRKGGVGGGGGRDEPAKSPPENAMLLRRDRSLESPSHPNRPVSGFHPAMVDQYRQMQAERERFLVMSAALEELRRRQSASHGVVACEKCEEEKRSGDPTAFHCCPNDPVIEPGFRTRAGPIARPVKRPGEEA